MTMSTPSWAPSRTSSSTSGHEMMRTVPRRAGGWVKRSFDVAASLVLLVLHSPVLLVCGAAVWLADGWPVLFRHERVGRYGRRVHVVKFRTMYSQGGGGLAVPGGPRGAPAGGVLLPRKLALARLYRRRYSWWLDARLMLATICTAPGLDSVATFLIGPALARRARTGLNGAPPRSPASGTDRDSGSGGTGSRQAGDVGWTE